MSPTLTVELHRLPSIGTNLQTLTDATTSSFLEQKSGVGSGEITLPNRSTQRDLVQPDDVLVYCLDSIPVFSVVVGDDTSQTISRDEGRSQNTRFEGAGLLTLLSEAIVYPSRGPDSRPIQEDRLLSWQDPAYDDSGWTSATVLTTLADAQANWPITPFAEGMPTFGDAPVVVAPSGATILLAPDGDWRFREDVVFASDGSYAFYFSPDNTGSLFVDGCPVMDVSTEQGYLKASFVNVQITAGTHTIAGIVHNLPGGVDNPTAGVLRIYLGEADQPSSTFIAALDATWSTDEYTIPPPGMTPGKAAIVVLEEAQARGALVGWTWDFTPTEDSNAVPWDFEGDISTRVGTDLRTFFMDEMAETYWDVRCDPVALVIHAYNKGTMGTLTSVELHLPTDIDDPWTGNLVDLNHKTRSVTANALLTRWQDGWHERAADPGEFRRKEAPFSLGVVRSIGEVERIDDQQLAFLADVRSAVTIGWEPIDAGDLPYTDCFVGDQITVPARDGSDLVAEILSLSVSMDENAKVTFAAEIADVIATEQERFRNQTKKMGDGTLRGAATVTTPPAPANISYRPAPVATEQCDYWVFVCPDNASPVDDSTATQIVVTLAEIECGSTSDVTVDEFGTVTINVAGDYEIDAGLAWGAGIAGADIQLGVRRFDNVNGGNAHILQDTRVAPAVWDAHHGPGSRIVAFNAGDTLKLEALHNAGSTIDVLGDFSPNARTYLQVSKRCTCGSPKVIGGG